MARRVAPERPSVRDKPRWKGSRVADVPSILLPERLSESLGQGHPWVYRDHVPRGVDLPSGSWVQVRSGGFSGFALWDRSSPIALRLFSRRAVPDASWFAARVREALALRAPLAAEGTSAYRLLYGEGDGVPGLSVDVYDRYAVIVTYADALSRVVPEIVAALGEQLELDGILERRRSGAPDSERVALLEGREPPEPLWVRERGVRLIANLRSGQKTGLFLDHRDNRAYVQSVAAGRRVLNLFSYTGAFSICAALGGASEVTSVDVAPAAIAAARENFRENGVPERLHRAVVADVFEYLGGQAGAERDFELVIADPPSFASSQGQRQSALRAYTKLHALCLARVAVGGLYAAASCTAQVSPEAFQRTLAEGAARARRRFQIVHDAGQPLDHPVFAGHPEGRYLKFVVGRVLELC